jgi:hypothetical protein
MNTKSFKSASGWALGAQKLQTSITERLRVERRFFQAFALGSATVLAMVAFVFSIMEVLYAMGWGLLYLLSHGGATGKIPATAWFFAADADGRCWAGGVGVLVCLAVCAFIVGCVASLGGWRWSFLEDTKECS